MEATLEKTQVELPADLAKRYSEAKNKQEQDAVLSEYARSLGAKDQNEKDAAMMSDEQFRTFLTTVGQVSAEGAKAAIAAIANDTERKYNLDPNTASEIAERSFLKTEGQLRNRQADMAIAAEVFRGMFLARQGKPSAYQAAIEKEAEHYKRVYGRQTRAMSLGTDSTGGYLAPTYFSDMLYEMIARTSLVRKYAKVIPMNANEIINIPTLTTGLSAAVVSEAGTASGVQPVFSQKQLTTKKIVTKTRPVSIEMIEKAHPAIIELLMQHAMIEILKAEDSAVFGTSGNGIRNTSTNLVSIGSVATSSTDYSSVSFDDMVLLESGLDAQYLIGEDIQGSGLITGTPRYFVPHAMKQTLKGAKDGTGRFLDEAKDLRSNSEIFGYGCSRVLSLPDGSSLSAGDKVAVFGNLQHVWCGTEPGFRILIADQGATDNGGSEVNLFDTAQAAVRVVEFFDSVVVDAEGFAIGQMAA